VAEEARRIGLSEPDPAPPDVGAVAAAFGLPGAGGTLAPVTGGWSNRLFRLDTSSGSHAVKELLNPWQESRFDERLAEAWRFERAALAAGVAMPAPIPEPVSGGCTADVARQDGRGLARVRVHRWADGRPAAVGQPVAHDVACWAGRTLAALHALRCVPVDRGCFPTPNTETADRWPALIEAARRAGAQWSELLARAAASVATVAALVRAGGHDPDLEVMGHADFSAKNLVLTRAGPVLCDWDVASPVVPRRELADAALSLGAWADLATAREVVRAYREAGGDAAPVAPADLGVALASRLDWIALNVEVALGRRPATAEGRRAAEELLPQRLQNLPFMVETALGVEPALNV
ncbi:MAG TPA: phosphotransferase, partial [Gaiellales bacterium]